MPVFLAIPGEEAPLLVEQSALQGSGRSGRRRGNCGCNVCGKTSKLIGIIPIIILFYILAWWNTEEPTYHDPLKDIDDIVGCSEKRVVYPRNNRNVNIFSNVKHFNILVTGNAFAAISISADEVEPYIQISTHFHSSSIHDSDLNVEYTETKDNKAESVATLIVKSPSVILTESCIVATVIIKIPAVISQGMSMNINGSKIGVDGRFKKIRVARLTLSAELLLARILNIEILDLLKIKAGNGAIAVYESKIGEADVNMKNGETTLLKSVVTSAATTSVYGDINVIDSAIVNNLELSSAYGSFNVSSVNVKGKLKATTDSGTIVANGIHGPFRGLFFETIDRPIHLEKLNASIMAKGASINLRSKLAQIQVDLDGYSGLVSLSSDHGSIHTIGDGLTTDTSNVGYLLGKRRSASPPPFYNTRSLDIRSNTGDIHVFFTDSF